jgi:ActR/RegA family two-component response regulator
MEKKLVIIEDEKEQAEKYYEHMKLNDISLEVLYADNFSQAKEIILSCNAHTAFLVDINLGPNQEKAGIEIIRIIRNIHKYALIIVFTGFPSTMEDCKEAGASMFFIKKDNYKADMVQIGRAISAYLHTYIPRNINDKIPKVFISYSWDKENNNKVWVKKLAEYLDKGGVDVLLDQYLGIGENFMDFIDFALENSDKVIIVFTKNYKFKAEKKHGIVGHEFSLITNDQWEKRKDKIKYLPILREGNKDSSVPKFMEDLNYLDMTIDEEFETNCNQLLWCIFNNPMKGWVLGK